MTTGRFERKERKFIHFTVRDGQIVIAVYTARYLTNRHIARLFFEGKVSSACKTRVRYLFDKGYLRKREAYPNEPDIYYLGLKGRRYVAKTVEGCSQELADKVAGVAGEGAAPILMMNHELTLADLYVSAALQCRAHGWTLEWRNTRALELQNLGVQPDAYLRVKGEGLDKRAFLEFTAVVPTVTELKRKLAGYTPLLEQLGGVPILWLTTSESKRQQLYKVIGQWLYHDWVLLGLIEDKGGLLTKKMWKWSKAESPVAFITPKETVLYRGEV